MENPSRQEGNNESNNQRLCVRTGQSITPAIYNITHQMERERKPFVFVFVSIKLDILLLSLSEDLSDYQSAFCMSEYVRYTLN